jgi:carbonic anhydrase
MRTHSLLIFILLIAGASTGWAVDHLAHSQWSYDGQEGTAHWGMLSPAYMVCESGSHQSPINITMPRHATMQEHLSFHYQSASVHSLDNGHTIQVNVPPGSELHLNGRAYRLEQFHFREPSEHYVDGRIYPMEIHLVHRDAKGHVVVVGLLVEGGFPNQSLAGLWTHAPHEGGRTGSRTYVQPARPPTAWYPPRFLPRFSDHPTL